ncbi:MAG: AtpZ/AtpI family protein [Pseudomonadota bacterium]
MADDNKQLRDRIARLQDEINDLQDADHAHPGKSDDRGEISRSIGMALRMGVEMVAALIVGVGVGLGLDSWLETTPIFIIVGVFLGIGAGISNVYRVAKRLGSAIGYSQKND